MPAPLEIVATPFIVYAAPVGEAFPLIDATPAGNWVKIGLNGDLSMSEDGVTIAHEQEVNLINVLGDTGPIKAFRQSEVLRISFTLFDITLETYRFAINFNTVTDTAASSGVAGIRELGLGRGATPEQRALLIKGNLASPYLEASPVQYQIPKASEIGSPEVVYRKGEPAGLALEWVALVDTSAAADKRFGSIVMMDEAQGA